MLWFSACYVVDTTEKSFEEWYSIDAWYCWFYSGQARTAHNNGTLYWWRSLFTRSGQEKLVFIILRKKEGEGGGIEAYGKWSRLELQAIHHYSEQEAAKLFCQCVQAIRHCHHMGVAHRDIKLDNFLLLTADTDSPIRLSDFGLSSFYQPGKVF